MSGNIILKPLNEPLTDESAWSEKEDPAELEVCYRVTVVGNRIT